MPALGTMSSSLRAAFPPRLPPGSNSGAEHPVYLPTPDTQCVLTGDVSHLEPRARGLDSEKLPRHGRPARGKLGETPARLHWRRFLKTLPSSRSGRTP